MTALRSRDPSVSIAVTTVTPTGAETARGLFGDRVRHGYLPYDTPGAVRRFLDRLQPAVAVMLETEIWPTLYFALHKRGIPIVLASARLVGALGPSLSRASARWAVACSRAA